MGYVYAPKNLPSGKAYACPLCGKPMIPDKCCDILHCFPCQRSVDLWWDKIPEVIEVKNEDAKNNETSR